MLDAFEMVAALEWLKNYGEEENKGFTLYDNDEQALLHEDAGYRI